MLIGTFANAYHFNGRGENFGFRFPDGNNYKYGWVKLKCSQHNDTLNIYEYAFHTIENIGIKAGYQNQ